MTEMLILGTSISLFGEDLLAEVSSSANYTVDDQDPINFLLPQPPNDVTSIYQKNFETGQLPLGQHKIVITYLGNLTGTTGSTVPLIFHYFIQQVGSSSTSSSIPSSTSSNTPTSSVPSGTTTTSSLSNPSPSSSTTNHRKPTEAIIGGVIGGLVLVSLLLALFFKRILNNRRPRALSEMSSIVPSPDVVNPFTSSPSNSNSTTAFLPQNFTSNGQSLLSQSILSKFSHRRGPAIVSDVPPPEIVNSSTFPTSNPNSTMTFLRQYASNDQSILSQSIPSKFSHQRGQLSGPASGASGGIPLNPFRPQFLSPAFTPSVSSPLRALPLTLSGSQTNHYDSTRTRVPQGATEPSMQRSPSPQGVRFLQHDDSGVRIHAEDGVQVVELPPVYSTE